MSDLEKPTDYAELVTALEKSGALLLSDPPKPDLLLQAAAALRSVMVERNSIQKTLTDARVEISRQYNRAEAAEARAAEYEKALERIACDCEKCWREEKDDCCHARAALHKEGPGPSSTACDDQFVPHWTERESMTKKPVQPQEAYMVADADGRIWYGAPEMDKDDAERVCSDANRHGIGRAPHRVIKVEITEVK